MNLEDSSEPSHRDEGDSPFDALLQQVAEDPKVATQLSTWEVVEGRLAPTSTDLPNVGDLLDGRYRVVSELGRGGMGVVYAARNERTERNVALKWMLPRNLLRTGSERTESVARFVREAKAVSRVHHPNVVRVFDVGGNPDAPYLVMEQLEGESLRKRLERAPLDWNEACQLLLPVMQGVAAVHRAKVIHRDLKPDNVMLCRDGPKVLDFGLSQIRADEADHSLTRTGAILGTPAFMPLEQLRGGEVDARTDVYALGVIWYQALTHALPFKASTAADQAVMLATLTPASVAMLRPELRGPRSDAVMKALARAPADRWQSVEAFAAGIAQAGLAQVGPRLRTHIVALVAAVLALTTVVAVSLDKAGQGARERAPVVLEPTTSAPSLAASPSPSPLPEQRASPPATPTPAEQIVNPLPAPISEASAEPAAPRTPPPREPVARRKVRRTSVAQAPATPDASTPITGPRLVPSQFQDPSGHSRASPDPHPLLRDEF